MKDEAQRFRVIHGDGKGLKKAEPAPASPVTPGTGMYVYLGSLVNVGAGQHTRTPGEWALYGVGLLATAVVTIFVTRIARKALARKISK